MRNEIRLILAAAVGFAAGPAMAQSAPGAAGSNQVIPEKERGLSDGESRGQSLNSGRSDSLSEKLDASGGVIKPNPGVDPVIVQPAPVTNPNSTPVIRPPGTPGGPPGPEAK